MKTTPYSVLKSVADEGPIIIIYANGHRSDVIILIKDCSPMHILLSETFLRDSFEIQRRISEAQLNLRFDPLQFNHILRDAMKKLWQLVGSSVVEALRTSGVQEGSRVWWCPTSFLSSLPFHAAGPISPSSFTYFSDLYISSYTPTLSALINARLDSESRLGIPRILVVAPHDESLPSVGAEVEVIKGLRANIKCLVEQDIDPERVLEDLQTHEWVHFSCHGTLVPGKPFDSYFSLGSIDLTLLGIIRSHSTSRNSEFAFLSTCHSAAQTEHNAYDEVIHLAATIQFSGFRSVVGTMWQMIDEDGPFVTENFYEAMFDHNHDGPHEVGYKRAARALWKTTRKIRENENVMVDRWVNYIHIGA